MNWHDIVFRFFITLTAVLVALVGSLGLFQSGFFDPAPYRNVEVVSLTDVEGEIYFVANFEKTSCTFIRLSVVGSEAGETRFYDWRDLDEIEENFDRSAGEHTLRMGIDLDNTAPDWLEIRTRHDCDGRMIDQVFYRIVNQIPTEELAPRVF